MLDKFKKYFSAKVDNTPASAETQKEVEMTVEEKATADAMAAQLKAQAADIEALTEMLGELSTKFAAANEALLTAEKSKADLVADVAAKKLAARKEKVVAIAGTEKAEAFMANAESFSDEQFEAVVGLMAASFEAEAKSPMFNEKGVAAEAPAVEVDAVKRLADKIAAQFKSE